MAFSVKQVRALKRKPDHRRVRTRHAHDGRELSYLEGWYAISEANRIFGFDGWSRETVESRCVLARENKGIFLAVYIARVRLTVQADGASIIREGHGSGEGRGTSPGEVHDIALKAAETDATKRALATFGKPFGLELYRGGRPITTEKPLSVLPPMARNEPMPLSSHDTQTAPIPNQRVAGAPVGFHPDDTTPIPRPSRFYGRRQDLVTRDHAQARRGLEVKSSLESVVIVPAPPGLLPNAPGLVPASPPTDSPTRIDKSSLTLAEPKRLRDKAHLKFVASQSCLVCGRQPSDPHHLRFTQPRAIGLKVSDEFTVPLCRGHHRELHQAGNELAWWEKFNIKPLEVAKGLWEQTQHPKIAISDLVQPSGQSHE
ncbi:MAG TPA: Rad52/Rad22 family DNA repair protein [Candidatus Methylomirabilis sp.]|nr:Rad52/Rad22 family DNA repair protein [Candidatus Methylomirabilis sp.]